MRSLAPGTLVDRYELVSPIGEGGMAQVWVARQHGKHGFQKLFAFKCIHDRFADVPAFRSMFLDEARIAAAIEHPNVAQVFDLGESSSVLYLVIEYVDGESLGALMTAAARRAGASVRVPTPVALRIIADACAGLHAAHRLKDADGNTRGVVHRDVSPQNLLVSVKGDVKVIDFGIAHAKDRIGGDTGEGSLKGKLHYMAPEQALREPIGPFTDVFAIGATLYRMLAGQPPFDGGNDAATLNLLLSGAAPAPLPEDIPPLVAAIVERALSRDPGDRYVSALEMQTALEQAIAEEGYVADVATWVMANASEAAKQRRVQLATRTMNIRPSTSDGGSHSGSGGGPAFDAELGLPPPPPAPPPYTPPEPTAPPPTLDLAVEPRTPIGPAADLEQRSMMDIRALAARAGSQPKPEYSHGADAPLPPSERGPQGHTPPPRSDPAPRRGEPHAAPARDYVGPGTRARPLAAGAFGGVWVRRALIATVLALVVAGVLLLLPAIVKTRIIAGAKASGIDLTIERVGVGFGNLALHGVTAKTARVPGITARADELFVNGFSAREVRVRGLDVAMAGATSDLVPGLIGFYQSTRGQMAGTGAEPRKISIVSAHLVWNDLLGAGTQLDANELGVELENRGLGNDDLHSNVGSFTVRTKHTTFGPWAATYDTATSSGSRVRVLLDPPVADGPSALFIWTKVSPTHVSINVPRSPVARLGVRLADLGLGADPATEAQLKLEFAPSPTMRNEASFRLDVFNAHVKGLKAPVDLRAEGALDGAAGKPLDLVKTTVTVAPFVASVTGSVTPTDLGFRIDGAWRAVPVPCEKIARAEARSVGPIAAALQELAHNSGVARVTGTASANGLVAYDTKTPDEATATVLARETCGLSIFGM